MKLIREAGHYIIESGLDDYEKHIGVEPERAYLLIQFGHTPKLFDTYLELLQEQRKNVQNHVNKYKSNVKGKRDGIIRLVKLDEEIASLKNAS